MLTVYMHLFKNGGLWGKNKTFWDAIPPVNIRGKFVARLSSGTTSSSQNTPMTFTARIVVISSNS